MITKEQLIKQIKDTEVQFNIPTVVWGLFYWYDDILSMCITEDPLLEYESISANTNLKFVGMLGYVDHDTALQDGACLDRAYALIDWAKEKL